MASTSKHRRGIVIGPVTWEQLRKIAAKEEKSISELVREGIGYVLQKRKTLTGNYDPESDTFIPRR